MLSSLSSPAWGTEEDKRRFLEDYQGFLLESSPYPAGEIVSGRLTLKLDKLDVYPGLYPLVTDVFQDPSALEKLDSSTLSKYPLDISSLELTTGQPDGRGSFKNTSLLHISGSDCNGSICTDVSLEKSETAFYFTDQGVFERQANYTKSQSRIDFDLQDARDNYLGMTLRCSMDSRVGTGPGVGVPQVDDRNGATIRMSPLDIDAAPVSIIVDGKKQNLSEDLYWEDGCVMVPLRLISESLGCELKWELPGQVIVSKGGRELLFKIDESLYFQGASVKQSNPPLTFKNDRLFVPLRLIAEELGFQVKFDPDLHTVILTSPTTA